MEIVKGLKSVPDKDGIRERPDLLILTRFGVGVTDDDWFIHRFRLFEAITLSSLRSQTDQDFRWLIFVGENPLPWVVERLEALLRVFEGRAVLIQEPGNENPVQFYDRKGSLWKRDIWTAESAATINRYAEAHLNTAFMITALIDDDDAWTVDTVMKVREIAAGMIAERRVRCGFTFEKGYEWLISDLIDIDSLEKRNEKVIRRSAVYSYRRPFLSMSCFVLSPRGELFEEFYFIHTSLGAVLQEHGYEKVVLNNETPAWLYVRHHQAESGIRKSRSVRNDAPDLNEMQAIFGIDAGAVMSFQEMAHTVPYALKRRHGEKDKSRLTFQVDDSESFPYENEAVRGKTPEAGGYLFNMARDYGIADIICRLAVYDRREKKICYIVKINSQDDFLLSFDLLPDHLDCTFKIQTIKDGKWTNFTRYVRLLAPL